MPGRSGAAAVLAAAVLTVAGCATTVGGTALPVTGLDTSPPSTSAAASSTPTTTSSSATTTRSSSTTAAPSSTGGGVGSLACTVLYASTSTFFDDYNAYVAAVNADSPDREAKKAVALTSTQGAADTLSSFPVGEPAVSTAARAMADSLRVVLPLLTAGASVGAINTAVDDVNTKYQALSSACGS